VNPAKLLGWRLLGFLLVLGGLEAYLVSFTTYGQLVVTERDGEVGWRMLPEQERWSRERDVPEDINAHGYRDRAWTPPARAGDGWAQDPALLRVAVLGNSMTYGTSVAIEDTWPRALEDLLDRALADDPRDALVMNFAVQGYVLEQMQRVYELDVRPFRPDVLLVPLHVGDLLPMPPAQDEFEFRYRRAWYRTSTRDLLFREAENKWVPRPRPLPATGEAAGAPDVAALKGQLKADPRAPGVRPLWAAAGQRLNAMQDMVAADGGRLAVVVLPTLEHLTDPAMEDARFQLEPWAAHRAEARSDLPPVPVLAARAAFGREQETLTRALVARFGGVEGLPQDAKQMRYLPPDLKAFDERLFLQQDVGHYSPRGHRLLAAEVHAQGRAAGLWP
jgi:lysophospholipase L1-like esterase